MANLKTFIFHVKEKAAYEGGENMANSHHAAELEAGMAHIALTGAASLGEKYRPAASSKKAPGAKMGRNSCGCLTWRRVYRRQASSR
jgi:hypothetical protein